MRGFGSSLGGELYSEEGEVFADQKKKKKGKCSVDVGVVNTVSHIRT